MIKASKLWSLSCTVVALGAAAVLAQNYPSKPIRIVTVEPGGTADLAARIIAQGIAGPLGQAVIVDNRPSAVTGELVAKSAPDGYTLLVGGNGLLITPLLRKTAYDVIQDFAPITIAAKAPFILVV